MCKADREVEENLQNQEEKSFAEGRFGSGVLQRDGGGEDGHRPAI